MKVLPLESARAPNLNMTILPVSILYVDFTSQQFVCRWSHHRAEQACSGL